MGECLIDWTARAAVGCYLVRLWLLTRRHGPVASTGERLACVAGALLLAAHVACAFQFRHGWSHAAATAHTARRTLEVVGRDWGGGIYFNYLTLAAWGADAVGVVWTRKRHGAPAAYWTWLAVGWIGFMILNATVVFGPRWWWGVGILVLIAAIVIRPRGRESRA